MIYEAMAQLERAPKIVKEFTRTRGVWFGPGELIANAADYALIADRRAVDWVRTSAGRSLREIRAADRLDLVFVECLYSFTIFVLSAWSCLDGLRKLCHEIADHAGAARSDFSCSVKPKAGIIAELREFRHKAVAHIARLEPRGESSATLSAYTQWNFTLGPCEDLRDVRFLNMDVTHTTPSGMTIRSEQVKLPGLPGLQRTVAEEFQKACNEIATSLASLASHLPSEQNGVQWVVWGEKERAT